MKSSYLQLRVNYESLLDVKNSQFHPTTELVFVVGELTYGCNDKNEIVKVQQITDVRVGFTDIEQLKEVRDIIGKIIKTQSLLIPIHKNASEELKASLVCSYQGEAEQKCDKPVYQCGVCKEHYAVLLENE